MDEMYNKDQGSNMKQTIGRRGILKKVSAAGVIGSISMAPLADIATANLSGDPEWTETYEDNSTFDNPTHQTKVGIGVCVEYYGSHINNAGNWMHEFRMNSMHSGRRKLSNGEWEKEGRDTRVWKHEFTVDISPSLSNPSMWTSDNPENLGCTPPPSDPLANPDYEEAAETAVQAAVGALHPYLQGGIVAMNILEALSNTDSPDSEYGVAEYQWEYNSSDRPFESSSFFRWFIEQSDGCYDTRFDIESSCNSLGAGQARVAKTLSVEQEVDPGYCTSSVDTDQLIRELSQRYEVTEVPRQRIEANPELKKFADDGPLYRLALPIRSEPLDEE